MPGVPTGPAKSPLPAPVALALRATYPGLAAKAAACKKVSRNVSDECRARALNASALGSDGQPVDFDMFGRNDAKGWDFRSLSSITRLVVHNGGYSAAGNRDTWERKGVASHYTIERSGHIVQHVGEEQAAGHAKGWNKDSIGIELNIGKLPSSGRSCNDADGDYEKDPKTQKYKATFAPLDPKKPEDVAEVRAACEPTAKQYESLRRLAYVISLRTSVPYDDLGIVGHCQSGGTHGDPKAFDWRELGLSNAEHRKSVGSCRWFDIHP